MIGVLDYGMGNISSVTNVLNFLEAENMIISEKVQFNLISHLIIPGVGAFARAIENIEERGFLEPIREFANSGQPVLGICLGMQLLADKGTEPYDCYGLGLVAGTVILMKSQDLRIPHMGWNGIRILQDHAVLEAIKKTADFYFVHSFRFVAKDDKNIIALTDYGEEFPSIISNDAGNVMGIQFHPEKSQKQGLKILRNFINLTNAQTALDTHFAPEKWPDGKGYSI